MIHSTAIIDEQANIANDVTIGPYTVIGPNVTIQSGTHVGSHVVIKGPTTIGRNNQIFQFASVGECPQDKKYQQEDTTLVIGDNNIIRECCTIHRGTQQDRGETTIGNGNLLMAYVHVAHDCYIADEVILANNASLAGHVIIDNYAVLGGMTGIHQFCYIGRYSFVAGGSMVIRDVPPYLMVSGYYAKPFGLNSEGLKRHGFDQERLNQLKKLYRIVYRKGLLLEDAIERIRQDLDDNDDVQAFLNVLTQTKRGIVR